MLDENKRQINYKIFSSDDLINEISIKDKDLKSIEFSDTESIGNFFEDRKSLILDEKKENLLELNDNDNLSNQNVYNKSEYEQSLNITDNSFNKENINEKTNQNEFSLYSDNRQDLIPQNLPLVGEDVLLNKESYQKNEYVDDKIYENQSELDNEKDKSNDLNILSHNQNFNKLDLLKIPRNESENSLKYKSANGEPEIQYFNTDQNQTNNGKKFYFNKKIFIITSFIFLISLSLFIFIRAGNLIVKNLKRNHLSSNKNFVVPTTSNFDIDNQFNLQDQNEGSLSYQDNSLKTTEIDEQSKVKDIFEDFLKNLEVRDVDFSNKIENFNENFENYFFYKDIFMLKFKSNGKDLPVNLIFDYFIRPTKLSQEDINVMKSNLTGDYKIIVYYGPYRAYPILIFKIKDKKIASDFNKKWEKSGMIFDIQTLFLGFKPRNQPKNQEFISREYLNYSYRIFEYDKSYKIIWAIIDEYLVYSSTEVGIKDLISYIK